MTALALPACLLPARRPGTERLQWLAPAPLWDAEAGQAVNRPWIAELTNDQFVPEFLQILGGTGGSSPADLANTEPQQRVGGATDGAYRLFQALSQRYYLVSASLVCRRPGVPDHVVRTAAGERASFVLRRIDGTTEQAWIPTTTPGASGGAVGAPATGSWQAASADRVSDGEEQLPLHPAPVAAFANPGSTAGALGMAAGSDSTRTVFYGYIPVGRRERQIPALAAAEIATMLAAAQASLPGPVALLDSVTPAVVELAGRVIEPWASLASDGGGAADVGYRSLYVLLDLGDWLATHLPSVHAALAAGATSVDGTARQALLDALQGGSVPNGSTNVSIAQALNATIPYAPLVHGADQPGPPQTYNLGSATLPSHWLMTSTTSAPSPLAVLADAAVKEQLAESGTPLVVPPELEGLIVADPAGPTDASSDAAVYVIRTVYEHAPCQPVLSAPSAPFVLARAVDGDAPARKIRIPLPDIGNMRRFNRGVALEMPPSLRKIMNSITPDILKGDQPGGAGPPDLGLICSFSLQIIFVCAFIVMFIFLLVLNIVFWWLPFLKICFPVPAPPPSQQAPSP